MVKGFHITFKISLETLQTKLGRLWRLLLLFGAKEFDYLVSPPILIDFFCSKKKLGDDFRLLRLQLNSVADSRKTKAN